MITKIVQWFVYSSKDPQKLALTVRGLAVGAVPVIIFGLRLAGINEIAEGDIQSIISAVENAIVLGFGTVSAVMTVYGLLRKVYITIRDFIKA